MTENQLSRSKTLPAADLAKLLGTSLGPALRLLLQPGAFRQSPRLLREGIDPIVHLIIQATNTALINQWLNHGTKVVFLSSFPRSGNTWMRFMLADVLLQMHGFETTTELPVDPDDLIPEFCGNSIARRLNRCPHWAFEPPLAFVKTHTFFARVEQILSGNGRSGAGVPSGDSAPIRDWKILYVYRSPEDALVSLFHYASHDPCLRSRTLHGIDGFCRAEVGVWVDNISSYLRAADDGFPVFFVSYESLAEKPAIVLDEMLRWLGVHHGGQMVPRAVSNMEFAKLQAREIKANKTQSPASGRKLFFRRGGPGSGRSELQESTLREIQQRTESLMSAANHRRLKQLSQHPVSRPAAPSPSDAKAPFRNGEAMESKFSPRLERM